MIQVDQPYESDITDLLNECHKYEIQSGKPVLFLSDWDIDSKIQLPPLDFRPSKKYLRNYQFWTNDDSERAVFQQFVSQAQDITISQDEFLVASNGTAALSLTLQIFYDMELRHALVVTPAYFTVLEKLYKLNFEVTEFPLSLLSSFHFDIDAFDELINSQNCDVVILTLPYFGTGVLPSAELLSSIVETCKKHTAWLLVDYLYGGMSWSFDDPNDLLFDKRTYRIVRNYEKSVLIDSISKRVFLNGCKFSLVLSNPMFIQSMENLSIIEAGSMCGTQIQAYKKMYSPNNVRIISNYINAAIKTAHMRYIKILGLIYNQPEFMISACSCGYFALVGISLEDDISDTEYAMNLIANHGIATTPHSRYLHRAPDWYCFRVNLLLQEEILFSGFKDLKALRLQK